MAALRRPVHFTAAELISTHGEGIARAAAACLDGTTRQETVMVPGVGGEIGLPYCPMPDDAKPYVRLDALVADVMTRSALDARQRRRCGLFVGTSSGDITEHERHYAAERARNPDDAIPFLHPWHGDLAARLSRSFGLEGPVFTFSTACSAGANALLYAAWMIRQGRIDHALVLGVELQNQISLMGFSSLLLIARSGLCRPFDVRREGIVLGAAVAATMLSAQPTADTRWRLDGGSNLCDASHPTNPSPDKVAETMRLALADAGCDTGAVVAVKAHGTGTPSNDLSEALGLKQLFGDAPPPFTSIKPVLGHTLGACGVVETLALQGCLERGRLPMTTGFGQADPALHLMPATGRTTVATGPVLLNFFGFGGNNCSLVMTPC